MSSTKRNRHPCTSNLIYEQMNIMSWTLRTSTQSFKQNIAHADSQRHLQKPTVLNPTRPPTHLESLNHQVLVPGLRLQHVSDDVEADDEPRRGERSRRSRAVVVQSPDHAAVHGRGGLLGLPVGVRGALGGRQPESDAGYRLRWGGEGGQWARSEVRESDRR